MRILFTVCDCALTSLLCSSSSPVPYSPCVSGATSTPSVSCTLWSTMTSCRGCLDLSQRMVCYGQVCISALVLWSGEVIYSLKWWYAIALATQESHSSGLQLWSQLCCTSMPSLRMLATRFISMTLEVVHTAKHSFSVLCLYSVWDYSMVLHYL